MPAAGIKKEVKKDAAGMKKGAFQITDSIQSVADKLWNEVNKRAEGVGNNAKLRSAELAIKLIKLQQSAFDSTLKVLARVQKHSEKLLKENVEKAKWMPSEGKDIVKEWSRTLNDGRAEFQKTVDKSYDLLRGFFERLHKEQKTAKSQVTAKSNGGAAKKPVAKKKPAAKKALAAKSKLAPEKTPSNM